jgi:ATP-dependent RNA/DNA helicase IGHMBP2
VPEDHFARLLRYLDYEAAAEAEEIVKQSRRATGDAAERSGTCLVGLVIRDETTGFGGRAILTLGKRDRRLELPWSRLNSGTPVVLIEENAKTQEGTRGVVTRRDREVITVAVNDSPEPIADRPAFRLQVSSDEIARLRQRDALRRIAKTEHKRTASLRRKLLGEEPPAFGLRKDWQPL